MDIVQKSGSWFSYEGDKLGQGRDAVKNILQDNPELCDQLENKIKEALALKVKALFSGLSFYEVF